MEYRREQFLADLKVLGLTQAEFARRLGLHRHSVAQWDRGRDAMPRWVGPLMRAWLDNREIRERVRVVAREVLAMMETNEKNKA